MTEERLRQITELMARHWEVADGQTSTTSALGIADELLSEVRRLRTQVKGHCERIAKQSELLTKKAEVS